MSRIRGTHQFFNMLAHHFSIHTISPPQSSFALPSNKYLLAATAFRRFANGKHTGDRRISGARGVDPCRDEATVHSRSAGFLLAENEARKDARMLPAGACRALLAYIAIGGFPDTGLFPGFTCGRAGFARRIWVKRSLLREPCIFPYELLGSKTPRAWPRGSGDVLDGLIVSRIGNSRNVLIK